MAGRFAAAFLDEASRFDRGVLFWWLLVIAPIGAALITTGLFQDWQMRDLPIAACDLDGFDLSRAFIRHAGASPSPRVAYEVQSEEEGLDLLRSGAVYAVLIIPRHLGRQVMAVLAGTGQNSAPGICPPQSEFAARLLMSCPDGATEQSTRSTVRLSHSTVAEVESAFALTGVFETYPVATSVSPIDT